MIGDLVLTPLVLLAATVPLGALLVRLAWRDGEPPLLLAVPVGFSALVLGLEACRVVFGGTPGWVLPAIVVAAVAAAGATRAFAGGRSLAWAIGGVLVLHAFLTAPVWYQAGRSVILGYNRNNDPVFLTVLAQLIAEGRPAIPPAYVTSEYLSYPAGSMDVIAAVAATLGRTAFDVTVPVHAITVALLLPCVMLLLTQLGAHTGRWAVPLAVLPVIAMFQVSYFSQGATPSMMMLVPLIGALLATWEAVHGRRPLVGALAGLCAGAAVTVYGVSTLGWIAAFAAVLVAYELSARGVSAIRPLLLTAAAALAGSVPALPGAVRAWRFLLESTDQVSGGLVLGNLGAALNPALAVGIDWTLLPVLTFPALAVAGLLTLAGIGWSLARGAQLAVMLLFACAFTTIYATLAGPYYVAKALSPASLVLVTLAVLGATRLAPAVRDRRPLALGFAACLALWGAGGVYTASHYLRTSAKTPAWLEAVGERREQTAARGPALIVSPTAQTWTAWALRNPGLQISQLVGLGSAPPDSALARYQTVVVEPGSQPPGPPFRPAGRVGDVEFFTR